MGIFAQDDWRAGPALTLSFGLRYETQTNISSPLNQRGGDDDGESPYKLELSVQVRNLFNRANGGTPVGNLQSALFGEPVSTANGFGFGGGGQSGGNRRVRFEVQFSF